MKKFFLCAVIFLSLAACKMAASGLHILSGDFDFPKLTEISANAEKTVALKFSKPVQSRKVEVYKIAADDGEPDFSNGVSLKGAGGEVGFSIEQTDDTCIFVHLNDDCLPGEKFGIDGAVKDKSGNTLSFSGVVTGFNARVPEKMHFNELRTSKSGERTKFVELKVLSDGNLAGVCILSAANSNDACRFEFPSVEVKKGDFVVLHVLPKETVLPKNELHAKSESKAAQSTGGWDFFTTDDKFLLSSTGVYILESRAAGEVIDAVLLSSSGKEKWSKRIQEDLAKRAYESKKWQNGFLPSNAFISDKLTSGAAANRKNANIASADAWERVTASKATPGA